MNIKIEFQDENHNKIAVHYIEYNTITPPIIGVVDYCERIRHYYPEVWFYYVTDEK